MKYKGILQQIRQDLQERTKSELREDFNLYNAIYEGLKYSTFDRYIRLVYNEMIEEEDDEDFGEEDDIVVELEESYEKMDREELQKQSEIDISDIIYDNEIVGIIGDLHFPYSKEGYLEFCYDVFKKQGVTTICQIGDLVDFHNWSRFNTEPYAEDGVTEFEKAYEDIQKMKEMFKEFDKKFITLGNHDKIPTRQASSLGLPSFMVKSFKELFELNDWEICTSKTIDETEYRHGIGCLNTLLTAQRMRKNLVCGHSHSKADIQSHANWDSLIWGMHVGTGVDDKRLAFSYAKDEVNKSIISCATVHYGVSPQLHFMKLN